MSVKVEQLTKQFGSQKAVNSLSFSAKKGEILGFLGPNGAGKSTTMKMITGYLQPSSGLISVCGHSPVKQAKQVQSKVGYLPEHNPLYKDMYVKEYLHFIARLHKVSKASQVVKDRIEWTGLEREQHKKIGALSKGYRQRVGLAQALLHDPEVLILDEPTSGLDPNQLVEIRGLIKKLGQEKTVIFSTHIMQEVQAICDRVVIINRGKLVADDPIDQLQKRLQGDTIVQVEFDKTTQAELLMSIEGVNSVKNIGQNSWEVSAKSDQDTRPAIFQYAVDNDLVLLGMQQSNLSVEDVFQELTK